MSEIRSKLTKRARNIIIQYALFRLENALIVAGTILLLWLSPKPFPWWPGWLWLVLGLLGVGAIFYSSISNTRANMELLLKEFQAHFDLSRIKLPELRNDMETALEYQRRIEGKVRGADTGLLMGRPENTANQLNDWIENIYLLTLRVDAFRRDKLLKDERESVPKELASLEKRLEREKNQVFRKDLEKAVESKRQQLGALQALNTRMKQAELQLTQSMAALATINSQVQIIEVQDADSGRSQRIQADIKEQVNQLNDLMASINEVYDYNTPGIG